MNVSEQESEMLKRLAAADGLDQADFLRIYIRHQHEARFGRQTDGERAGR